MPTFEFEINERNFTSGPGWLVWFRAEVELKGADESVTVIISPADHPADHDMVAKEVRVGAERALSASGRGAEIRVVELHIHPVDFLPKKFAEFTEQYLRRALQEYSDPSADNEGET